jgi:hypothetical protein
MDGTYAFTDEYGDPNLSTEKAGVSTFFILTAVLVPAAAVDEIRRRADRIRSAHFGPGEMKSSSVGQDDKRRLRVLAEITELDFTFYSLAVDKRELDRESGLAYRRSFFKYINRRLYERVYRNVANVTLIADKHGTEEFLKGFLTYVDKTLPLDLFTRRDISFADSRAEIMLQIADMLSGSLARILDPGKRSPEAATILSLLQKRALSWEVWPPEIAPDIEVAPDASDSAKDAAIRTHCMRQARIFLQRHLTEVNPSDDLRAQLEVLQTLIFNVQFREARRYVATGTLIERVQQQAGIALTERQLRAVVSGLRDAGVVIGTSSKGYKLPVCERDMDRFASHTNTIVPPMLARVRRARDDLKLASLGKIDILASPAFDQLRRLVEALDQPAGS